MSAEFRTTSLTITKHANGVSVGPTHGPCTGYDPSSVHVFTDPKAMAEYIMATLDFRTAVAGKVKP